ESAGDRIGRITTTGLITEFALANAGSRPTGITQGPGGSLWFVEYCSNLIGQITTSGKISEYQIPTAQSDPSGVALARDGSLWGTESLASQVVKLSWVDDTSNWNDDPTQAQQYSFGIDSILPLDGSVRVDVPLNFNLSCGCNCGLDSSMGYAPAP